MSKFYRANEEIRQAVLAMSDAEEHAKAEGLKLSRKHGGSRIVVFTSRNAYGEFHILGFRINKTPDPKIFMPIKGVKNGYRPHQKTGAGRKLYDQLRALKVSRMPSLIGMLNMQSRKGLTVTMPGIRMIKEQVYVELPDDVEPPEGCVRISDVEMESICANSVSETA